MKNLFFGFLFILISGCGMVDSMSDGIKHSREVAADLERAVGERPFVGFNWSNGILTDVSVRFDDAPANKSLQELVVLSRQSVGNHFAQSPTRIVISFVVVAKDE